MTAGRWESPTMPARSLKDLEGHLVLASLATNPVSQGLNSSSDGSLTR